MSIVRPSEIRAKLGVSLDVPVDEASDHMALPLDAGTYDVVVRLQPGIEDKRIRLRKSRLHIRGG